MSTDLCVPAYLGAGGTWREEGQSQSHIPRRLSKLSAFPSGTSATRLVASSTTALDHEYLKGGGVLVQSVWGVVSEKEQRFGIQPRLTRSAYSRRRSLAGTVKRGSNGRGSSKKLVKGLECHDSQTTVEVVEEHTQPEQAEPIEVEDEDSSTIVCAIDTRLQNNITDSSEQLDEGEEPSTGLDSSNSPSTTVTSPFSPTPQLANPHSPKSLNMSSRSSRHSSSSSSSFPSASKEKHLSPPCHPPRSPPPKSPKPTTSTSKPKSPIQPQSPNKPENHKDDKDDWHQIHEPEQRRRIQNRIAQRKFREKARSLKDQAAREEQNRRYAGGAYTCPGVEDLPPETYEGYPETEAYETNPDIDTLVDGGSRGGEEGSGTAGARVETVGERVLSGLPWGGLSMRFVVGRGHEYYQYQRSSSGRGGSGSEGSVTVTGSSSGGSWPAAPAPMSPMSPMPPMPPMSPMSPHELQLRQQQRQQHLQQQAMMFYGDYGIGGSSGPSGMDMDVDYAMVSGAGTGGGDMEYVTSPRAVSMAAVTPGSGSGSGGHGSASTGMDVTYYDSSSYYYDYGSGGGGDAASGSGGSVYGGHGGRGGRM